MLRWREELVPDRQVAREFGGISAMSLWRWSRRPEMGFPRLVKMNGRNYRLRSEVESYKTRLVQGSREPAR